MLSSAMLSTTTLPSSDWPSTNFRPLRKTMRSLGSAAQTSTSSLNFSTASRSSGPTSGAGGGVTTATTGGGALCGVADAVPSPPGRSVGSVTTRSTGRLATPGGRMGSTGFGRGTGAAVDRAGGGGGVTGAWVTTAGAWAGGGGDWTTVLGAGATGRGGRAATGGASGAVGSAGTAVVAG